MKNFLKRNVKLVVVTSVAFFIIAGLSTALITTNVAQAHGRDRDRGRDRSAVRMELTEEQIAERAANARERLEQRLADGRITQEEFDERNAAIESGDFSRSRRSRDNGEARERTELTEEQKAERLERARERLEQRLADGDITQEEYNEKLAAIESGEYPFSGRGRKGGGTKGDKEETPVEAN